MTLALAALATYKATQVILSLLPREPMPWVKVILSVLLALVGAALVGGEGNFGYFLAFALSVATLAGATHTVLRLLTYLGDMALRKSVK